jgi:hypothetical protein
MRIGRIWSSIRQGKNIELYLVLVISIVAIALGILDIATTRLVPTLTVTAVGLVGLALLEQRATIDDAVRRVETITTGARFEQNRPYDLAELLRTSSLVMLAGVDLARTFSNFQAELSRYLLAGHELRIMLYDPDSHATEYATQRSKRPFNMTRQVQLIKDAVADFGQLRLIANARIEIRLSSAAFPHGIVAGDYHDNQGVICLKYYRYRLDNYDLPWMRITSADGIWYGQFAEEIDVFWSDARAAH